MLSQLTSESKYSGDSLLGRCVDEYLVTRKLGQGGMGEVYEAVHIKHQRKVALKVLRPRLARNPKAVRRFSNEASVVTKLRHPGIANVLAASALADGSQYFLMEHLPGETLGRRLRVEPNYELLPALRLAEQLASTLAVVHGHGIVHCDLKPDNIMIVPAPELPGGERAVLLDFGIARPLSRATQSDDALEEESKGADHLLGTPLYMSPEQSRGAHRIDDKADVYALGVLLFRLSTGRCPFVGEVLQLLVNHAVAQPPSPRLYNPALSQDLEDLILRMLAKAPNARPSMAEVASILAQLVAGVEAVPAVKRAPQVHQKTLAAAKTISTWALAAGLLVLTMPAWNTSSGLQIPPPTAARGNCDARRSIAASGIAVACDSSAGCTPVCARA